MPRRITLTKRKLRPTFIKSWRKYRNLSQDRLVERVSERVENFSKSSLSRIENSKQPYSQDILEALAWALNCEPEDLLMRDPESEVWSIMDTLKKLPPNEQAQVRRIVDTFRKSA